MLKNVERTFVQEYVQPDSPSGNRTASNLVENVQHGSLDDEDNDGLFEKGFTCAIEFLFEKFGILGVRLSERGDYFFEFSLSGKI